MTPTGLMVKAIAKQLTGMAVDVALLPVTVPLTVLDVVQPLHKQPDGWPCLIRLPL